MKNILQKTFLFIVVFSYIAFFPMSVKASTIFGQYNDSIIAVTNPGGAQATMLLGTGLSGTVQSLTFSTIVQAFGGSGGLATQTAVFGFIDDCPTSAYTGCTQYVPNYVTVPGGAGYGAVVNVLGTQYVTLPFSSTANGASGPFNLNSSDYYYFGVNFYTNGGAPTVDFLGAPGFPLVPPCYNNGSAACSMIVNPLFFDLGNSVTSSYSNISTSNRITLGAPADGTTTASTTVTFSGQYYINSSVSFSAGAPRGCDVAISSSDGLGSFLPETIPASCNVATTDAPYSWIATTTLLTGRQFAAHAELLYGTTTASSTWTSLYVSPVTTFSVVSVPSSSSVASSTCTIFSFTSCITEAFQYMFVPSADSLSQFHTLTLANTFPFSYMYDVPNLLNDFQNASNSSTSTFLITVPLSSAFGTSTIIIFSPALIQSVPFYSYLYTILGFVFIFFTAFALYEILLASHDSKK